jgi:hypothetical protein
MCRCSCVAGCSRSRVHSQGMVMGDSGMDSVEVVRAVQMEEYTSPENGEQIRRAVKEVEERMRRWQVAEQERRQRISQMVQRAFMTEQKLRRKILEVRCLRQTLMEQREIHQRTLTRLARVQGTVQWKRDSKEAFLLLSSVESDEDV